MSPRGDFSAHPRATDDLAAVTDADVVFVALKAYSLTDIAPRLGSLLAPGAAAVWAQNGIHGGTSSRYRIRRRAAGWRASIPAG